MSNKISNETKQAVLEMNKQNISQRKIADELGISVRSVGRIISNYKNTSTKMPVYDIKQMGDNTDNHVGGSYVVQDIVVDVMNYIRRELKGIEALTYLIESKDTPENLKLYRQILVNKLSALSWWKTDAELVKLGIHKMSCKDIKDIHNGDRGIEY